MTDLWSDRADDYRNSSTHAEGADLDLVVEWCEPAAGITALDVATGGGHVARRLRERGASVVTADPAPGMRADTTAFAEDLPFADASFDVVACRIAAHHFADVNAAIREMARVASDKVVIEDNLFFDESSEEAERLRDPSHVRCYSQPEWEVMLEAAGLRVDAMERFDRRVPLQPWLDRVRCTGDDATRVVELLGPRVEDGTVQMSSLVIRARK
jgi:SAM-dependent methyltransferase